MAEQTLLFCIGAAKAGTSWLFDQMRRHPACRISRIKEMHYFNTLAFGKGGYYRRLMVERLEALRAMGKPEEKREVLEYRARMIADYEDWLAHWDGRTRVDEAYLDHLGRGREDLRVIGDFTPAYGLLTPKWFGEMAGMMAKTRFIYVLRDPVERLWSQCRMDGGRGEDAEARALAKVDAFLAGGEHDLEARSNYRRTLNRLFSAVAREHVHIELFERLFTKEANARLARFTGLEDLHLERTRKVHVSRRILLDDARRARLREALRQQYNFVEKFFGELPGEWAQKRVAA